MAWWQAFLLTLALEGTLLGWGYRRLGWLPRLRWWGFALALLAANLTHPVLWALRPASWPVLLVAEIVVAVVEGGWYALVIGRFVGRREARTAFLLGACANVVSFAAGLLLAALG